MNLHILTFLVCGLLLSINEGDENNPEKVFGKEYFPQKANGKMLFDSNLGETSLNILSFENKSTYSYKSGSISYKQHFRFLSKGIYLLKTESKALFFGTSAYYKKPILRLPFPFIVGQKWNWKGYEYFSENDSSALSVTGEIISEEIIEVPAGKYETIKVKTKLLYSSGEVDYLTEWYAPNIGVVKFESIGKTSGLGGVIKKLFGLQTIVFELKQVKG